MSEKTTLDLNRKDRDLWVVVNGIYHVVIWDGDEVKEKW